MYLSNSFAIKCIVVSLVVLLSEGRSHRRNSECHKIEGKDVQCKPRPQVVSIPREIHEMFHPNAVVVNRCSGSCLNMRPCNSTRSVSRCFKVYNKVNERDEYRAVEEDLECQCCDITEDDCNDKQIFDADQCKCQCTNDDEMNICEASDLDVVWDESHCVCSCRKIGPCLSSDAWSAKDCSCLEK